MERAFRSVWFTPFALALIGVSVFITYSNTFSVPFQFDDASVILENRTIRSLGGALSLLPAQRGVSMFTFALNYAFGGYNVAGWHAVNIVIHVLSAIAAYFLVLRTMLLASAPEGRSKKIAFFSSLIFALHPIQTQAVTYIVQRQESLSSLFYLVALLFFIASVKCGAGVKRNMLYACVAASYVLSFYSKEIGFTLPAVIFLYDVFFVGRGSLKALSGRWPLYAVLGALMALFLILTVAPLSIHTVETRRTTAEPGAAVNERAKGPGTNGADYRIPGITPLKRAPSAGFGVTALTPREYLYTEFNVIVYYLSLLIFPANQNLDYDFPVSKDLFSAPEKTPGTVLNIPIPPPAASLAMLAAIFITAVFLFFKYIKKTCHAPPVISFFILWFFVIIAPTSSFMPIVDVIYEHRIYLASLGFFVIFVIIIDAVFEWLSRKILKSVQS